MAYTDFELEFLRDRKSASLMLSIGIIGALSREYSVNLLSLRARLRSRDNSKEAIVKRVIR